MLYQAESITGPTQRKGDVLDAGGLPLSVRRGHRGPVIFHETPIAGVFLIEVEPRADDRGFLARTFCVEEFAARGLTAAVAQSTISFSHVAGTLRGLHYREAAANEVKLIRCTSGGIYDVVVDLRPASPTFRRHYGVELNPDNRLSLYVPTQCANGCQALADRTEFLYLTSAPYSPGGEHGLRYDDPALGIAWPLPVTAISDRDRAWSPLGPPDR
jgi:dTDP-4-dehydrorhamnose 3,5-epimerase